MSRNLVQELRLLLASGTGQAGQPVGGMALEKGEVVRVDAQNRLTVIIRGVEVTGIPVTDQPFKAGMLVWVSPAEGGTWVVHGGVQ